GADEPGQSHDLTSAHGQRDVVERADASEPANIQHDVTDGHLPLGENIREFATDHQRDHLRRAEPFGRAGVDLFAIAQDGDLIGQIEHFAQAVADVDHCDSICAHEA